MRLMPHLVVLGHIFEFGRKLQKVQCECTCVHSPTMAFLPVGSTLLLGDFNTVGSICSFYILEAVAKGHSAFLC